MEPLSGLQVHEALISRGLASRMPVLFLSGHGDIPMAVGAMARGAFSFVEKPYADEALVQLMRQALALELQYHPAAEQSEAMFLAAQALVIRELLQQRCAELGLTVEAGAVGFIPKTSEFSVMVAALDMVLQGGVYLPKATLLQPAEPAAAAGAAPAGADEDDMARAEQNAPRRAAGVDGVAGEGVFVDEALDGADGDGVALAVENAGTFAKPFLRADARADLGHVARGAGNGGGLEELALGGEGQPFGDAVGEGAGLGAARSASSSQPLRVAETSNRGRPKSSQHPLFTLTRTLLPPNPRSRMALNITHGLALPVV